jgi:acyl-coenzyme A thioesterase 13
MRDHLKLVSATAVPKVTAVFEFKVVRALCNRLDNMHGGAISLVYDMCTTMAMAPVSKLDFWFFGGVSRTLSVTFLRPVKLGMEILVECELVQIGTRLGEIFGLQAFLRLC